MSFWDIVWFIFISFAFMAYLMVMFSIITDLFRDPDASGFVKAVWIVALIFVPFLTALVYLIARGKSMAERQMRERGRHAEPAGRLHQGGRLAGLARRPDRAGEGDGSTRARSRRRIRPAQGEGAGLSAGTGVHAVAP